MSSDPIRRQVADVFSLVLRRRVGPDESVSAEVEPAWDSLKQVELVFAVEDALGVRFDAEELPGLTSLARVVDAVVRLRDA